ncbi:MAG: hypothetical protein ACOC5T_09670 [Elusimicrobiota bacterium]
MKTYKTNITLEVQAETEEEAINKMYEQITLGEVQIKDLEVIEDE